MRASGYVDPRGPRFGAAVTTVVLAAVLLTSSGWLLAAQAVGLGFAAVGTVGYLTGVTTLGVVATAFALVAAFLNAAFDICLGCEVHLRLVRLLGRPVVRYVPKSEIPTAAEQAKEKAYA